MNYSQNRPPSAPTLCALSRAQITATTFYPTSLTLSRSFFALFFDDGCLRMASLEDRVYHQGVPGCPVRWFGQTTPGSQNALSQTTTNIDGDRVSSLGAMRHSCAAPPYATRLLTFDYFDRRTPRLDHRIQPAFAPCSLTQSSSRPESPNPHVTHYQEFVAFRARVYRGGPAKASRS